MLKRNANIFNYTLGILLILQSLFILVFNIDLTRSYIEMGGTDLEMLVLWPAFIMVIGSFILVISIILMCIGIINKYFRNYKFLCIASCVFILTSIYFVVILSLM